MRHPPIRGQAAGSTAAALRAFAATLIPITNDRPFEMFDDFDRGNGAGSPYNWAGAAAGSGAVADQPSGNNAGGILQLSTGVTINSSYQFSSRTHAIAGVPEGRAWFMEWYGRMASAIDAQMKCGFNIQNIASGKSVMVGVVGPLDAANFVLQYDGAGTLGAGSKLSLGAAADQIPHRFRAWSLGDGKIWGQLDSLAAVNVTPASSTASPCMLNFFLGNGAAGTANIVRVDYLYFLGNERAMP